MKMPYQIDSDYYALLHNQGWYKERIAINLNHCILDRIKKLDSEVKNFVLSLWYISFIKRSYYFDFNENDISDQQIMYIFGETTDSLSIYDEVNDYSEYFINLLKTTGSEITLFCFGTRAGRDILIDSLGRIYEVPDSGELYFMGAKYYEGLYNLIYNKGKQYRVDHEGVLTDEENNKFHINDF